MKMNHRRNVFGDSLESIEKVLVVIILEITWT